MKPSIMNKVIILICISGLLIVFKEFLFNNYTTIIIYLPIFLGTIYYILQKQKDEQKELYKEIKKCKRHYTNLVNFKNSIPQKDEYIRLFIQVDVGMSGYWKEIENYELLVNQDINLKTIFKVNKDYSDLKELIIELRYDISGYLMEMITLKTKIDIANMKYENNGSNSTKTNTRKRLSFPQSLTILGIKEKDLSLKLVKKTYHKLVKKYHPDNGGNSEKFNQIHNAYTIVLEQIK